MLSRKEIFVKCLKSDEYFNGEGWGVLFLGV